MRMASCHRSRCHTSGRSSTVIHTYVASSEPFVPMFKVRRRSGSTWPGDRIPSLSEKRVDRTSRSNTGRSPAIRRSWKRSHRTYASPRSNLTVCANDQRLFASDSTCCLLFRPSSLWSTQFSPSTIPDNRSALSQVQVCVTRQDMALQSFRLHLLPSLTDSFWLSPLGGLSTACQCSN